MKLCKVVLFVLASISAAVAGSVKSTFHGEISDSQCAMNVHSLDRSHQEMIKKGTLGTDAASCARACVRRGGVWVLRSGEEVYRLQNQDEIEQFAGRRVVIEGTLDTKTRVLDNRSIRVETAKESKP